MREMGRGVASVVLVVLVATIGGCVSGSLATNTGPHPPQQRWSPAAKQMAHVGEQVDFDFVLVDAWGRFRSATGAADYCAVQVGDERLELDPDEAGRFRFSHRFDRCQPGERVAVRATAYAQRGRRDFIRVQARWLAADEEAGQADRRVAAAAISMTVYQAAVELSIPRGADEMDFASGVLRIHKVDGRLAAVHVAQDQRRGFVITGPDGQGRYQMQYRPDGDELNPTGTTSYEFVIEDVGGRRHTLAGTLPTP